MDCKKELPGMTNYRIVLSLWRSISKSVFFLRFDAALHHKCGLASKVQDGLWFSFMAPKWDIFCQWTIYTTVCGIPVLVPICTGYSMDMLYTYHYRFFPSPSFWEFPSLFSCVTAFAYWVPSILLSWFSHSFLMKNIIQ